MQFEFEFSIQSTYFEFNITAWVWVSTKECCCKKERKKKREEKINTLTGDKCKKRHYKITIILLQYVINIVLNCLDNIAVIVVVVVVVLVVIAETKINKQ